jgi:hypothetical protein
VSGQAYIVCPTTGEKHWISHAVVDQVGPDGIEGHYQPSRVLLLDNSFAVERLAAALLDAVGGDDPRHDDPWSQNFAAAIIAALRDGDPR